MRRCSVLCLFILLYMLAIPLYSQLYDPSNPEYDLNQNRVIPGQELVLHSDILNEDRVISICLPDDYHQNTHDYPVLYILDGETHLFHAYGAVNYLSANGYIPGMIVVAVRNIDRNRDFSPVHVENIPTSGGAEPFLNFIGNELKPYMDQHFRTSAYDILMGHSFGGVFAVYALLEKPDLFDAYIAVSPYLQFADDHMIRETETKLHPLSQPVSFYMTLGDEPRYVEALDAFTELIKEANDPNFTFDYVKIMSEDHMSNPYPSLYRGLRFIFSDWRIPGTYAEKGLEAVETYYHDLSKKYGMTAIPPENLLNNMGYALLQNNAVEEAIVIFKANVKYHPDSPNVYDSLGEAQEANGQLKLAKKNYKKAWDLGVEQDHAFARIFEQNYLRIK